MTNKRHQRRKAHRWHKSSQRPEWKSFNEGLKKSLNNVDVEIISPREVLQAYDPILLFRVGTVLVHFVKVMMSAHPGNGPRCANCDHEFPKDGLPALLVIARAYVNETAALTCGICPSCAESGRAELEAIALAWWRRVVPNASRVSTGGQQ